MSASKPVLVNAVKGRAYLGSYGKGTKSEREAVYIEVDAKHFLLRMKTGPAFGDTSLLKYVDSRIECDGFLVGSTFLAEVIRRV